MVTGMKVLYTGMRMVSELCTNAAVAILSSGLGARRLERSAPTRFARMADYLTIARRDLGLLRVGTRDG